MFSSIVVFCGSNTGKNEIYCKAAYETGKVLAEQNISIVYGGARIGVMGALATGALEHNGEVCGVIPRFLKTKEVAHENLTKLLEVETMHERKLKMHELSDGIIALPGGWGTMEELFEMMTWAQLGLHPKPIGILNINGFYNPLLEMIEKMLDEGFIKPAQKEMILVNDEIETLLEMMKNYRAPEIKKWITGHTV
jgi:uncharacterized protein (TIGR00730 family)